MFVPPPNEMEWQTQGKWGRRGVWLAGTDEECTGLYNFGWNSEVYTKVETLAYVEWQHDYCVLEGNVWQEFTASIFTAEHTYVNTCQKPRWTIPEENILHVHHHTHFRTHTYYTMIIYTKEMEIRCPVKGEFCEYGIVH